jgi:hypothetical protein
MTKRDFTETAKMDLKRYIDDIDAEEEGWWDSICDFFCDFFIDGNIQNYGNDIARYHEEIVDKNDTSKAKIDEIWANVYNKDSEFRT